MKIVLIKNHSYGKIGDEIEVAEERGRYLIMVGVAKVAKIVKIIKKSKK